MKYIFISDYPVGGSLFCFMWGLIDLKNEHNKKKSGHTAGAVKTFVSLFY